MSPVIKMSTDGIFRSKMPAQRRMSYKQCLPITHYVHRTSSVVSSKLVVFDCYFCVIGGCVEESLIVLIVMCDVLVSRRRRVLGGAERIRHGCGGRPIGQLTGRFVSRGSCSQEGGSTHKGEEEENDVHDTECERGLEHGAILVHVHRQSVVVRQSKKSKWTQI